MNKMTIAGPSTINGIPAEKIVWEDTGLGPAHVHLCKEARERRSTSTCEAKLDCPVCGNPNTVAIHQDVNATIWCPVGHITHLGDGVSVALNGF